MKDKNDGGDIGMIPQMPDKETRRPGEHSKNQDDRDQSPD